MNFDADETITTKLLGILEVPNSTGNSQEKAVKKLLTEQDIENSLFKFLKLQVQTHIF